MLQNDSRAEENATIKRKNRKKYFSGRFRCFCPFLVGSASLDPTLVMPMGGPAGADARICSLGEPDHIPVLQVTCP